MGDVRKLVHLQHDYLSAGAELELSYSNLSGGSQYTASLADTSSYACHDASSSSSRPGNISWGRGIVDPNDHVPPVAKVAHAECCARDLRQKWRSSLFPFRLNSIARPS